MLGSAPEGRHKLETSHKGGVKAPRSYYRRHGNSVGDFNPGYEKWNDRQLYYSLSQVSLRILDTVSLTMSRMGLPRGGGVFYEPGKGEKRTVGKWNGEGKGVTREL